jgi:hypothetical protein
MRESEVGPESEVVAYHSRWIPTKFGDFSTPRRSPFKI